MHGIDDTRVEEFCQFKKKIRGSKEYLIEGNEEMGTFVTMFTN